MPQEPPEPVGPGNVASAAQLSLKVRMLLQSAGLPGLSSWQCSRASCSASAGVGKPNEWPDSKVVADKAMVPTCLAAVMIIAGTFAVKL